MRDSEPLIRAGARFATALPRTTEVPSFSEPTRVDFDPLADAAGRRDEVAIATGDFRTKVTGAGGRHVGFESQSDHGYEVAGEMLKTRFTAREGTFDLACPTIRRPGA